MMTPDSKLFGPAISSSNSLIDYSGIKSPDYGVSTLKIFDENQKLKVELLDYYNKKVDNNLKLDELENIIQNYIKKNKSSLDVNNKKIILENIKEIIDEKKTENKLKKEMKKDEEDRRKKEENDRREKEERDNKLIVERKKYEASVNNLKDSLIIEFSNALYNDKEQVKIKLDNVHKEILQEGGDVKETIKQRFIKEYYERDLLDKIKEKKNNIIRKYSGHKNYKNNKQELEKDINYVYDKLIKDGFSRSAIANTKSTIFNDTFDKFVRGEN
jgi:hypothetical protein